MKGVSCWELPGQAPCVPAPCHCLGQTVLRPLSAAVEVLGLGQASDLILIPGKTAEEHAAANHQQRGTPAEAVCPRVEVVALVDQLVELDWVDDERDDLENHCAGREKREMQRHAAWNMCRSLAAILAMTMPQRCTAGGLDRIRPPGLCDHALRHRQCKEPPNIY